ncbi:MAG TPA: amidase [Caulobacteraceae bacterium]|jgi:aspartyl-tRNA(Asn)/glutamyl-tRNA(Gln) amidotransferase subunit A|nr:amidase [Caulobacteraceae bacterium]
MTLSDQARALASGETTSRALVEASLDAIARDPRPFTAVFADEARAAAAAADRERASGDRVSQLAGLPISVKDLFEIEGLPTPASTVHLREAPIAERDAPVVSRLKGAGLIIVGRTQMSPFAFSGIGLNPHLPQAVNPRDPERVPGGSSSGAGVSVGLGQTAASIGTDTGGSVRIPAAVCGVVGFKPTKRRITTEGAVPLAPALDSIGPLATTVEDCRLLDAVMADASVEHHGPVNIGGLRLGVVEDFFLEDLEPQVAQDFERAVSRLSLQGVTIERLGFAALNDIPEIEAKGALVNAQAYAVHRQNGWIEQRDLYDPNVLFRLEAGGRLSSSDYLEMRWRFDALAGEANRLSEGFDALVAPTCAITAPKIAEVQEAKAFGRANSLLLRNARIVNLIDRCAISLPMHEAGNAPTGLMLIGETMGDARLLAVAAAIEAALA